MSEEVYRPQRTPVTESDLSKVQQIQAGLAQQTGVEPAFVKEGVQVSGNVPPQFANILNRREKQENPAANYSPPPQNTNQSIESIQGQTDKFQEMMSQLTSQSQIYETITLPSLGKFYNGTDGPTDGKLEIREMTGNEEQILATSRFTRRGEAVDMIFNSCIRGGYRSENLLSIDRKFLLFYLRGISYTENYEVEITCPNCQTKFPYNIDLNTLNVEFCPDNFSNTSMRGTLPVSKFPYNYRLARGLDEKSIQDHRTRKSKFNNNNALDDSLIYTLSVLIEDINGVTDKMAIQQLLKNMRTQDLTELRNQINDPPFGVETEIDIECSSCLEKFDIDLPIDTNFFFPRRQKTQTSPVSN